MEVVLTNLSNRLFEDSRIRLNNSARKYGIDSIRSYDFEELRSTSFYEDNREILDQPTGMGYWLWKPYIILEALKSVAEGDIVVYSDSGIEIIAPLDPLLTICQDQAPVLLFGNGDDDNATWTKRDCFMLMGCDQESFWKSPQCDAAFCLFRRSDLTMQFVSEWLGYCRDPRILTDIHNTSGKRDLPDFIAHRRDQSVISLLAAKYRFPLFRMPTQFGNHYKTYPYRLDKEFNCVNQYKQRPVNFYAPIPYYNSPYFQLLNHHRGQNKGHSGPGSKTLLPFILRVIRKRYKRWVNTIALWRES